MATCRICQSEGDHRTWYIREMMYGTREVFEYFECSVCGCLQISAIPEDMSPYYPQGYYSFRKYDGKKFRGWAGRFRTKIYESFICRKTLVHRLLIFLFTDHFFYYFSGVNLNKQSRILDVGCGNGHKVLYPMAEAGFKNVAGCDPFIPHDLHYPNGLTIRKGGIAQMDGRWDIIMYHHAFEHVPDPLENLRQVYRLLEAGGVCILRLPTVSSYAWRKYREYWYQADAPRHFFLHSVRSMEILASQAGFRVAEVRFDATYKQFAESERYVRDLPLTATREKGLWAYLRKKIRKMTWNRHTRRLNRQGQGDQAIFYLVKDES